MIREPGATDRTATHQVQRYLDFPASRQRAGQVSVGEFSNARAGLIPFRGWAPGGIDGLNADAREAYYLRLIQFDKSIITKRKHLIYTTSFVMWLSDKGLIEVPRNLNRRYGFTANLPLRPPGSRQDGHPYGFRATTQSCG